MFNHFVGLALKGLKDCFEHTANKPYHIRISSEEKKQTVLTRHNVSEKIHDQSMPSLSYPKNKFNPTRKLM